jgi:hypothetical protein
MHFKLLFFGCFLLYAGAYNHRPGELFERKIFEIKLKQRSLIDVRKLYVIEFKLIITHKIK